MAHRPTTPVPARLSVRARAALSTALLAALLAPLGAMGAEPLDPATHARIRDAVQRATGVAPDTVEASTLMPGYFEVRAKGAVAYVDRAARHLVKGPVIDLATGENLTQSRQPGAPARIDVATLPLADAITTTEGAGARQLYVFVDPNCSFCRNLEPELAQLHNVRVHRFVTPVLGPGAHSTARKVWCAPDRAAAWRQAVAAQALAPAAERCDAKALDRNLALARRLGVTATPTLVFASGERVAAAMPAAEIENRLAGRSLALAR